MSETVTMIDNAWAGGVLLASGANYDLDGDLAATLVAANKAIYVTDPVSGRTSGASWAFDEYRRRIGLVGPDGSIVRVPYTLLQCSVPIGIAPTGTMGANGAVTLGTALNATYDGGIWLYFPAGAVYAGSAAGFYWCVMSSATDGTVYDNTYVPGTSSFDIPASPTAIVAAGPGAYTGFTGTLTAVSMTLPGGSLGNHGSVEVEYMHRNNSSANNKGAAIYLDGTSAVGVPSMTTNIINRTRGTIRNQGRQDRQVCSGWLGYAGYSSAINYYMSKNTASDKTLTVVLNSNTSGANWSLLDGATIAVFPS